jgi:1-acyl-sn-glycerol-3-phosphate acyltransferase
VETARAAEADDSMWLQLVIRALRPVWGLHWDFRLEGDLASIPLEGPLVVVANHSCFLDPWFIAILLPRPATHFLITRRWYDRSRFWGWFFRAQGTIPVGAGDREASAAAVREVLRRGELLGIFPEGKISGDGKLQRFHSGVAWVAAESGAPVIPIGIRGAFLSLPRNRWFPKRGPIALHIGKPMVFPGSPIAGAPDPATLFAFRKRLRDAVLELAGQAGTEPPAENNE